jgi:hypothetical protein
LRIRRFDCGEKVQWIKVIHVVVAPLYFGHRRCTGDMARTVAYRDARCGDATDCERAGKKYWEVQELTTEL